MVWRLEWDFQVWIAILPLNSWVPLSKLISLSVPQLLLLQEESTIVPTSQGYRSFHIATHMNCLEGCWHIASAQQMPPGERKARIVRRIPRMTNLESLNNGECSVRIAEWEGEWQYQFVSFMSTAYWGASHISPVKHEDFSGCCHSLLYDTLWPSLGLLCYCNLSFRIWPLPKCHV